MMATLVIETTGTQEYTLSVDSMLARIESNYGTEAAQDIGKHLSHLK